MRTNAGPLSADKLNPLIAQLEEYARDLEDMLMRQFYESGHPVGTEKLPEQEIYARLVHLRDAGAPEFWQNPQAQKDLEQLSKRFGAPRPVAVPGDPFTPPEQAAPRGLPGQPMGGAPQVPQLALVAPVSVRQGSIAPAQELPQAVTGGR